MIRRNILYLNTHNELAIRKLITGIEHLGADPKLTDIVVSLDKARNDLSDFIDKDITFGALLSICTKSKNIIGLDKIPDSNFQGLKSDSIWTNRIPVKIFGDMLLDIGIPVEVAIHALRNTLKILIKQKQSEEPSKYLEQNKGLLENEESFNKYINRLKDLLT